MHGPSKRKTDDKLRDSNEDDEEDEDESEENDKPGIKKYIIGLARDILIAVIVMVIIIGSLWGYTGNWPPMVVIESSSMMHGDDSSVGTIDTGDLVLVKSIDGRNDVKTYWQGKKTGYETYGSYGDVIIFRKNGISETPVIHRAVVWVEYNASAQNIITVDKQPFSVRGFDVPSMGKYNVTEVWIENFKPNGHNLSIKLGLILLNFQRNGREPHSGFITKGDNNKDIDQTSNLADSKGRPVEPVDPDWVVGKAEGELPWFGLIKLFIGGETSEPDKRAPDTSVRMLIISIVLIIIIPIILDLTFSYISKKRKKRQEKSDKEEGEPDVPGRPPIGTSKLKPQQPSKTEPVGKDIERGGVPYKPQREEPKSPDTESGSDSEFVSKDDLLKKIK
jgi:signal peptidase